MSRPSPSPRARPGRRRHRRPAGFTLVELLVVIGIIAVLIGILLPALSAARRAGLQTKSLSNIRQLGLGYSQYHIENRGWLPFGYPPAVVDGGAIKAALPSGAEVVFPVASRYPWRLINYVADVWPIIHGHKELPPIPLASDSPADAEAKAYGISLNPTYGINAYYVGGHYGFYGFDAATGKPNATGPSVSKITQARHPSHLIALADATASNIPGVSADDGWFVVTPPRVRGVQWTAELGKCVPVTAGVSMGLPQGRYGRGAVCCFVDGHAESLRPDELTDMTYWANGATTPDWTYSP